MSLHDDLTKAFSWEREPTDEESRRRKVLRERDSDAVSLRKPKNWTRDITGMTGAGHGGESMGARQMRYNVEDLIDRSEQMLSRQFFSDSVERQMRAAHKNLKKVRFALRDEYYAEAITYYDDVMQVDDVEDFVEHLQRLANVSGVPGKVKTLMERAAEDFSDAVRLLDKEDGWT